MDPFWMTTETVPPGMGWPLFSLPHLCWLAACALSCAAAGFAYSKIKEKGRKIFRVTIAVLLIISHIVDNVYLIATGQWNILHLPLHLCSLSSFLIIIHAFLKKENNMLAGLCYAMALPGAVLALATPSWCAMPVWNFSALNSWMFHILMIMYVVILLSGGYRPSFVHIRKTIPILLGVIACIFIFNKVANTDFLYMNGGKDVGWVAALADDKAMGMYGYLIIFPVIMAVLWTAMFLPFDLHRIKKMKRAESATVVP